MSQWSCIMLLIITYQWLVFCILADICIYFKYLSLGVNFWCYRSLNMMLCLLELFFPKQRYLYILTSEWNENPFFFFAVVHFYFYYKKYIALNTDCRWKSNAHRACPLESDTNIKWMSMEKCTFLLPLGCNNYQQWLTKPC